MHFLLKSIIVKYTNYSGSLSKKYILLQTLSTLNINVF